MYYQNYLQVKNPFLRGRNSSGDSGFILSTDAKPRLKWTQDLHERFIEAVKQLGGADKATPKTIMKVMAIPGLTLYHLKSHLQKYRLNKNLNGQANRIGMMEEKTSDDADEIQSESLSIGTQTNKNSPTNEEAMQMQIEVQRRLHEQLEVQRHLQLKIEAQGKYLQSVLEKAQETLGRQNLGAASLKAAKVQLSELVSSAQYTNSSFLEPKEIQNLCTQQKQPTYLADCSLESCLTSSEGAHNRLRLRTYLGDSTSEQKEVKEEEEPLFQRMEFKWTEEGLRGTPYLSRMVSDAEQRISYSETSPGKLSIGVGMHRHDEDHKLEIRNRKGVDSTTEIDLNTHVDSYCTRPSKQLDLNGFSWN